MIDYNDKLEKLIKNYGLNKKKDSLLKNTATLIREAIEKVIKQFEQNPRMGIWGAGIHTDHLLEEKIIEELNLVGIFDRNEDLWGRKIKEYTIMDTDEMLAQDIDVIIISSYTHKEEIKESIRNNFPQIKYIDIYEENKHIFPGPFYTLEGAIPYKELFYYRNEYFKNPTQDTMSYMICEYLYLRDFVSATIFLKEYVSLGYNDSDKMKFFLRELEELLNSMKGDILGNQNENIIFILADSLRGKDILDDGKQCYMPFLDKFARENILFKNAFSPSVYTSEAHRSIFSGKHLFEGDTFKQNVINSNNSKLLSQLKTDGYEFYIYSGNRLMNNNFFQKKGNFCDYKLISILSWNNYDYKPVSMLLWDYYSNMLNYNNHKNFSYIWLLESHVPYISGYDEHVDKIVNPNDDLNLDSIKMELEQNYFKSIRYIDYQLEFYFDMLSDNDTLVLISDHGSDIKHNYGDGTPQIWGDNRIHVLSLIKNKGYSNMEVNDLFSTKDIGVQLLSILKGEELNICKNDYVIIERSPIYNENLKASYMARGISKQIQALRMIRTEKEKYIIYQDGTEEYYLLTDETINLANNPEYLDRIQWFRNLEENNEFPDFGQIGVCIETRD